LKDLSGTLEEKRSGAGRLVGWCDTILVALKDVDFLKRSSDSTHRTRTAAAAIADYKGSFTLRIFVGPYAELTKLTRNGKDVPVAQRITPLVVGNLEIGDYELELTHPQFGKKVEKISAGQLKNGKVYQLGGQIKDAKLRMTELP
jgi:hypothetical protein